MWYSKTLVCSPVGGSHDEKGNRGLEREPKGASEAQLQVG